jgi:hypothetical protein
MASYDEIFGLKNKTGGGGGAASQTRQREAAHERQAEEEHKSHGREIVFNLYALLPGGKRSNLIASVNGFPDKSGTASAEFTLFLPKNEERLIVKPVETYQYVFTAKHKYSKEIVGPMLTVVDHAASTANFIPENIQIDLPGGVGDIRGSIASVSYLRTIEGGKDVLYGGVSISLEFRNRSQKNRDVFNKYKWKQTITTNDPAQGRNDSYEDVLEEELKKHGNGHEYWFGDGQDREYLNPLYNVTDGDYFKDIPARPFLNGKTTSWQAKLAVYGIEKNGSSKLLGTIKYGFYLSNGSEVSIRIPILSK